MSTTFETFFELCSSSGELLGPIIQALERMRKIAQKIDDAVCGITGDVNPTVAMAIADLKVLYHTVGSKARVYITSCKDIASYVCESGVLEAIKEDLEDRKSAKELDSFLDDLLDYMTRCKSNLQQFNAIRKEFKTEANQNSDQWTDEAKKKREEEKKSLLRSLGFGTAGTTLGAGSLAVVAVASTITCPPVFLALAAGASVGAAASFGMAGAFALERGISNEQKKVFLDAAKFAVDLYTALTEVQIKIDAMEEKLELAKTYIGDEKSGLTKMVKGKSSVDPYKMRKITADLELLRKKMEETLHQARDYLK
eukprot:Em0209g5a